MGYMEIFEPYNGTNNPLIPNVGEPVEINSGVSEGSYLSAVKRLASRVYDEAFKESDTCNDAVLYVGDDIFEPVRQYCETSNQLSSITSNLLTCLERVLIQINRMCEDKTYARDKIGNLQLFDYVTDECNLKGLVKYCNVSDEEERLKEIIKYPTDETLNCSILTDLLVMCYVVENARVPQMEFEEECRSMRYEIKEYIQSALRNPNSMQI